MMLDFMSIMECYCMCMMTGMSREEMLRINGFSMADSMADSMPNMEAGSCDNEMCQQGMTDCESKTCMRSMNRSRMQNATMDGMPTMDCDNKKCQNGMKDCNSKGCKKSMNRGMMKKAGMTNGGMMHGMINGGLNNAMMV